MDVFRFFRGKHCGFLSCFFASVAALFLVKCQMKKRYKDVTEVRLIPLCKMRLYQCVVRKKPVLSCDLR